jgi:hypothetical protein
MITYKEMSVYCDNCGQQKITQRVIFCSGGLAAVIRGLL